MIIGMTACSDHGPPDSPGAASDAPAATVRAPDQPAWVGSVGTRTLRRAVRATAAVEQGRVEWRTELEGLAANGAVPGGVDTVRLVHRAAFDRTTGRASVETDMSDLAAVVDEVGGVGDFTLPARMLIDGDSVYTQVGPLAETFGLSPTVWIRRDLDSVLAQGVDSETAAVLLAPLGTLDILLTPALAVEVVGGDEVRGERVVHLRATLDLGAGAAVGGGGQGSHSFGARLRAAGVDHLPIDVWLDAGQVVRRLDVRLDPGLAGGSGPEGLTTTFELHDVGVDPGIRPPAATDVVDAADVVADRR